MNTISRSTLFLVVLFSMLFLVGCGGVNLIRTLGANSKFELLLESRNINDLAGNNITNRNSISKSGIHTFIKSCEGKTFRIP